jgi:DNA-binding MarR family transcriptional regulator
MKGTYLGEFEEIVLLAVAVLHPKAYAVNLTGEIERQADRQVHISAVQAALYRLEEKGFLRSELGEATAERGGKRKRLFFVTPYGVKALQAAQELRLRLWGQIPPIVLQGN